MNLRSPMLWLAAGCGLWLAAAGARAQTTADAPPDRVARLAVIDGSVSLRPAGSTAWGEAPINRPVGTGDRLWVPAGSRASLELGGTEIRLDGGSAFGFLHLGTDTAQAQLTAGTLNLNVRHLFSGQNYEIDTPTLAFVADHRGQYRIDIAPNGKGTQVTVFSGEARVYGEGGVQRRVSAGNSYRFIDPQLAQVEVFPVPRPDSFDRWCFARDARYERNFGPTREYVSTEVIGYQDLADYGSWQNEVDYGPMWFPSAVPVGWAPYRFGHWAWIAPWGWTWIDDAPWGFAPFHYGRWAFVGGRWGWVPGPLAVRPVYAPALVAFVGFGGGWGGWNVGIGLGGPVGWYPLAPGVVFVPWYRCGPRYFRAVNVTNIRVVNQTVINNIDTTYNVWRRGGPLRIDQLGDRRIPPRALTVVPKDVFVHARPVGPHNLQPAVPLAAVLHGPATLAAPPAPGRGSLMAQPGGPVPQVPRPVFAREVLAHRPPPRTIAALPQRNDGYRLARGTAALPAVPARIAENVHVIGSPRRQSGRTPGFAPHAPPAAPAMNAQPHFRGASGLPSARFVPHRWQPGGTLPQPARIEPAPQTGRPGARSALPGERGMPRYSAPHRGGGTFSVIGSGPRPATGGGYVRNYPGARPAPRYESGGPVAQPRGPGFGQRVQVIEAPRYRSAPPRQPAYGAQAPRAMPAAPRFESGARTFAPPPSYPYPRAPMRAAEPFHAQAPPAQFREAPPPQFRGAPPPQFRGAPPPQFREPPPAQFRAPPARATRTSPRAPEQAHPPHGGGGGRR